MEVMTILVLLVLSIALPTLDTVTDINLVSKLYTGAPYCLYDNSKCEKDPVAYCSNYENNLNVCRFATHPKMATTMLTPFLLNYVVCFLTFLRKEKNTFTFIFAFIFALLNLYPQFGKKNH